MSATIASAIAPTIGTRSTASGSRRSFASAFSVTEAPHGVALALASSTQVRSELDEMVQLQTRAADPHQDREHARHDRACTQPPRAIVWMEKRLDPGDDAQVSE